MPILYVAALPLLFGKGKVEAALKPSVVNISSQALIPSKTKLYIKVV
jgi:hypothetical protein